MGRAERSRRAILPAPDGEGYTMQLLALTEADDLADRRRSSRAESPSFSPRETDCLARLVHGLTDQEIANDLEITHATVRFHLDGARRKANARSRTHLAALAVALGVAQP
jgi:DNA-binding CsgD family transcriptional regulator